MKFKLIVLISIISSMLVFVACSADIENTVEIEEDKVAMENEAPKDSEEVMEEEAKEEVAVDESKDEMMLELTLEELKEFDGSNGDVIYVAVDGVIYDVSHLDLWKGGKHKQGITAGKDLTKEIKESSPHGVGILKRAEIVGKIVE